MKKMLQAFAIGTLCISSLMAGKKTSAKEALYIGPSDRRYWSK